MERIVKPTPNELAILKLLWSKEPLSAKEIHDEIGKQLDWSNSSTRKTLDRMRSKEILETREVHGTKVYITKTSKINTLARYIKDFSNRVLEIDGSVPIAMFADSKILDSGELKLLDDILSEDVDNHD